MVDISHPLNWDVLERTVMDIQEFRRGGRGLQFEGYYDDMLRRDIAG